MTTEPPVPMYVGKQVDDLVTLGKNPLLAKLGIKELSALLDLLDQVAVTAGTVLAREGQLDDYMFFVLDGHARVSRGDVEIVPLGPGDHFGEAALAAVPRHATVVALSTMRLARLSLARYRSLAQQHPSIALHLAQAIISTLGDRLAAMTDTYGLLLRERSLPRRTAVRVATNGVVAQVPTGTRVRTLLPAEAGGAAVVGALVDNKPVALDTPLVSDARLAPLSLATSEGREIYTRSVGLVLLEAAHHIVPGVRVNLGPSLGEGQIVRIDRSAYADASSFAAHLTAAMQRLVADDVPLREELWSTEEARKHFADCGWEDAAALLRMRRDATVPVVSAGVVYALGTGPVLSRAGAIQPFRLVPHPEGLLLDFGDAIHKFAPRRRGTAVDPFEHELRAPRFSGEMATDHKNWLASLGITSVGTFNECCISGQVKELVRLGEGFHEKRVGMLADAIAARRSAVRIICIAGPSSSGKTTCIKRLSVQLAINGMRPLGMSLDDYYVDREKTPKDEAGEYDYESIDAIDAALLRDHVARLLAGESVKTSRYDFVTGKCLPANGPELRLAPGDVLLMEGIHGLNPALLRGIAEPPSLFRIFIHPATTLSFDRLTCFAPEDVRLLRRIVRDRHHRGASAADTIVRFPSVVRGEKLHIFPFLMHADAVFDSSLVYEPSVVKVYAERYLLEVPQDHPAFPTAYRLRQLIDRFVAIYPDHVPPTSIIREFIGGSGFEY